MFDNIGGKIKVLAKISCWGGIVVSVLLAFTQPSFLQGLVFIVVGSLLSWISSFTLYGLGQLIDNTDTLVEQGKVKPVVEQHTPTSKEAHRWMCDKCGKMISTKVCPYCGQK